ncbi:efflux RND transporter periplasmic adaptor subunit [candidate division WOR-3 bacterium]|nr:efflux RND transporter periplasmic adaptor subunit [candidate division WOR-3 bacterium]
MKKFWILLALFIIILIVIRFVYIRDRKISIEEPIKTFVETTIVSDTNYDVTIDYYGNIKGFNQASIFPDVPGKFIKYLVREGNYVKKGQAIAEIDRAIVGLEFKPATVKSPISGTIGNLSLSRGEVVIPNRPIATVASLSKVKIIISVPDKDLLKIKSGSKAYVKSDVYPDKIFNGYVSKVASMINPVTSTGFVEITVNNINKRLRPGFVVNTSIKIGEYNNIFIIESAVVKTTDKGNFAFILNGSTVQMIAIDILYSGKGIAVVRGLNEGDKLIIKGVESISDKEEVEEIGRQ